MMVNLNVDQVPLVDLARDPFHTVLVDTAGAPAINRRGGAHDLSLDTTNEAQKVDALSDDGFALGATAPNGCIIEMAINVTTEDSSATGEFFAGIASGTAATLLETNVAQLLGIRLNGNSLVINVEAQDGTNTLASTSTTISYVVGTRFEVWIDARNPAAVLFYVNGVQVLASTACNVSAGASTWKLLAYLIKTANAAAMAVNVDWLRARIAEQF
jgi:hypothetical protein